MKSILVLFMVALSLSSTAFSAQLKEPSEILREAKKTRMTGIATPYIAEQIKAIQKQNHVSEGEALDMIIDLANEMLSLNY